MTCCARFIKNPILKLKSLKLTTTSFHQSGLTGQDFEGEDEECVSLDSFEILDGTTQNHLCKCVLLKACIVAAGIITNDDISLSDQLTSRFGGGVEIICCSRIPSGSGMGGSSILAAVILKALLQLTSSYMRVECVEMSAGEDNLIALVIFNLTSPLT